MYFATDSSKEASDIDSSLLGSVFFVCLFFKQGKTVLGVESLLIQQHSSHFFL